MLNDFFVAVHCDKTHMFVCLLGAVPESLLVSRMVLDTCEYESQVGEFVWLVMECFVMSKETLSDKFDNTSLVS